MLFAISLYAFCCSSFNVNFSVRGISLLSNGFLSTCFSIISKYPFLHSVFTTALVVSANISRSDTKTSPFSIINFNVLICLSDFILPISISYSISSGSFFKVTKFTFFSFTLFVISLLLVPGGNINFKQSDILQKYLVAIHFANSIFSSDKIISSCTLAISFVSYSDVSFIPITKPSSNVFILPNGTKTLLPIFTFSLKVTGI